MLVYKMPAKFFASALEYNLNGASQRQQHKIKGRSSDIGTEGTSM